MDISDVVIPLADAPSEYGDLEIEYAIKSWCKFSDVQTIYLIGKPRDIDGDVEWIDSPDRWEPAPLRHENVRLKLLEACKLMDKPFIYSNDDIFVLKPVKLAEIPLYHIGLCKDFAETKGGHYKDMMVNSTGNCFEVHMPMPIEPELFIETSVEGQLNRTPYGQASSLPKERIKTDPKYSGQSGWDWFEQQPYLSVAVRCFAGRVRRFVAGRVS